MRRQKLTTILGVALAFACAARPALAQTQATTANATPRPGGQDQSAAALAQEASNPFAAGWALQLQQNNNWTEMPGGDDHTRVQSNLQFQPLLSLRLTGTQGLIIRPIVTIVNSIPHVDQSGQNERTAGVRRHRSRIRAAASVLRRPAHGRRRPDVHFSDGIDGSAQSATHGRWGLMREPCYSASTSSAMASYSNGSRSAETGGTPTR